VRLGSRLLYNSSYLFMVADGYYYAIPLLGVAGLMGWLAGAAWMLPALLLAAFFFWFFRGIHQFLWRRSHAVSDAKQELSGKTRKRDRVEPGQVTQDGFRLG
jgi:fatty acid desaturase